MRQKSRYGSTDADLPKSTSQNNKIMNILITLPKHLIDKIIKGEKKFEMRKCLPKLMKIGEDGFFVVEKGTNEVRCWCRVDHVISVVMNEFNADRLSKNLCVSPQFILDYAPIGKGVYLWEIGKVNVFECLRRDSLFVEKNPQQFAYCPLSYGESF